MLHRTHSNTLNKENTSFSQINSTKNSSLSSKGQFGTNITNLGNNSKNPLKSHSSTKNPSLKTTKSNLTSNRNLQKQLQRTSSDIHYEIDAAPYKEEYDHISFKDEFVDDINFRLLKRGGLTRRYDHSVEDFIKENSFSEFEIDDEILEIEEDSLFSNFHQSIHDETDEEINFDFLDTSALHDEHLSIEI